MTAFINSDQHLTKFQSLLQAMLEASYLTSDDVISRLADVEKNFEWLGQNLVEIEKFFGDDETTTPVPTTILETTSAPTTIQNTTPAPTTIQNTTPAPATDSTTLGAGSLIASFAVIASCAFINRFI